MQVKHGDGVSYTSLADETEGFSGADLRAIVSEAQLSAVMAHLERLKAAEAAGGAPDKHAAHETPLVSAAVRAPCVYFRQISACPMDCRRVAWVRDRCLCQSNELFWSV